MNDTTHNRRLPFAGAHLIHIVRAFPLESHELLLEVDDDFHLLLYRIDDHRLRHTVRSLRATTHASGTDDQDSYQKLFFAGRGSDGRRTTRHNGYRQ